MPAIRPREDESFSVLRSRPELGRGRTLVGKVVVVDTVTIDMASVIACVVEADDPVPIVFEGMTKSFVCWDPAVDDVESNSIVVIDWGRIFTVGVDAAVPAVVTFGGSSVEGVCEPCTATLHVCCPLNLNIKQP